MGSRRDVTHEAIRSGVPSSNVTCAAANPDPVTRGTRRGVLDDQRPVGSICGGRRPDGNVLTSWSNSPGCQGCQGVLPTADQAVPGTSVPAHRQVPKLSVASGDAPSVEHRQSRYLNRRELAPADRNANAP
jgi:hypothetical protein